MYFEVNFSMCCQYAGETILEVLYRVVASDPFNTGKCTCIRDNSLHLALF